MKTLQMHHTLPAIKRLENEGINLQILPLNAPSVPGTLRIAILNLMPQKEVTEADLLRLLANSPYPLRIEWMKMKSHTSKNVTAEHMDCFYRNFEDMKNEQFDGLIITGAPVENIAYEEVDYWQELTEVFDWAHQHVPSTLYICWAAMAGLYYFHHIPKYGLDAKMFGIFAHHITTPNKAITQGFDGEFYIPHSRHTEIRREDVIKAPGLTLIAESNEAGVYLMMANEGKEFFITGHSEYEPYTLDKEYKRDVAKGLPIALPKNYYRDNNPQNEPVVRWRAHAHMLIQNWLKHYVNK